RDYRDSRAVLDTQWSFLRCVLMGLAAERRKNVAPAEARGFVSVLNPAPEGRKTRPRIFRPFRGSASPDQGTPGARPVKYTHLILLNAWAKQTPLLGKGGVDAPSRNIPVPLKGADGVVRSNSKTISLERTTPSAPH